MFDDLRRPANLTAAGSQLVTMGRARRKMGDDNHVELASVMLRQARAEDATVVDRGYQISRGIDDKRGHGSIESGAHEPPV
jgi:hypothetical protein